jgi:hypothetical protein
MRFFNNSTYLLSFLIGLLCVINSEAQQITLKGIIASSDSTSVMPFAYVINTRTGHGQLSDMNGEFSITANLSDSVLFSFIGYQRLKVPVKKLYLGIDKVCKVIMKETTYKINQVVVSEFKLKPYERDYMKRVISNSRLKTINAVESPISALYMEFSKKGKEQKKLAKIFEEIFIQEEVGKKFNGETLRKLTGDETIDFEKFRKYCYYLSNDFIINTEGYDLYYRVMDCYYRWKEEGK